MSGLAVDHVIRTAVEISCRGCGQPIEPGSRAAFVPGRGYVHLRCLLTPRTPEEPATTPSDQEDE